MSTFDGHVAEFPNIRIDRFRLNDGSTVPSLANFLSHVHTDHLIGLDSPSYGGPFIYCSSATREMLLRLEKYPTRMNFANGITETRQQTYKHLRKLLKPIALETPTWIELSDGYRIRVTLFDANHCAGAVSFLIEGDGRDSKAILYTGDVRSEPWWVQSLSRYSFLNPYLRHHGKEPHKRLDTIYLDTTFANKSDPYQHFPTKAQGISELLAKVSLYPKNTLFYLNTWTFGYEDVWQAMATYLDTGIHVDQYKYGVYDAIGRGEQPKATEYFKLIQSHVGNHAQQGCLVADGQPRQIHSCEQGAGCYVWNEPFVRITPIISRHGGKPMREPGAGGGEDDLSRQYEIQFQDQSELVDLVAMIVSTYQEQPDLRSAIVKLLKDEMSSRGSVSLEMADVHRDAEHASQEPPDMDDLSLEDMVAALANRVTRERKESDPTEEIPKPGILPKHIMFPFSRHSSYSELCALVQAFVPKDIYPCTIVPEKYWKASHSMAYLFGHIYTEPPEFRHDQIMFRILSERVAGATSPGKRQRESTPENTPSPSSSLPKGSTSARKEFDRTSLGISKYLPRKRNSAKEYPRGPGDGDETDYELDSEYENFVPKRLRDTGEEHTKSRGDEAGSKTDVEMDAIELRNAFRQEASDAALGNDGLHWSEVGLVSVSGHQEEEEEL